MYGSQRRSFPRVRPPESPRSRGSALPVLLLILVFVAALIASILASAVSDLQIADSHLSALSARDMGLSGIEVARAALQADPLSTPQRLSVLAGVDGRLSTERQLNRLLASDDSAWVPADPLLRLQGYSFTDTRGQEVGRGWVFLRNIGAEDGSSVADRDDVVEALSVARVRGAQRVVSAEIERRRLPLPPSTLLVNGPLGYSDLASQNLVISGTDRAAAASPLFAVGTVSASDAQILLPLGQAAIVPDLVDTRLENAIWLDRLAQWLERHATERHTGLGPVALSGVHGTSTDPRLVWVEGDCVLGASTGFGILVVRGRLLLQGPAVWEGWILVVGQGVVEWAGPASLAGVVMIARTRDTDRNPVAPLGTSLPVRGPITLNLSGASGSLVYDSAAERAASSLLPWAIRAFGELP